MSDEPIPTGLSASEWSATPPGVQTLLLALLATVQQQAERIATLEERLQQSSCNSSKPPSSDPPDRPVRLQRTPSGRKAGGQAGHAGHGRALKPVTEVSRVVECKPTCCEECGALLLGADPAPVRRQVSELPRIEPEVTEYQQHRLACLVCGHTNTAAWPVDMPNSSFGPRLQGTVGYLTGRLGVSQRDVAEVMDSLFHVDVSLGSVPALEQAVSAALATPNSEVQAYVQQQPVVNADETGWHEGTERRWLWIAATPLVCVFLLLTTRGAAGAKQLLDAAYAGIVGSDRWSAYNWLNRMRRQLCWAHLRRDFQALVDRGGASTCLGEALLAQVRRLFDLWHRVREGTLRRPEFQVAVLPIQNQVHALLQEGAMLPHPKTRHLCQNLLKLEPALWTFVTVEGVEPTNNSAERPLRRAVLWRRRSFGTQSSSGSQFVERVLTAVMTLRLQHRDVLDYLTAACTANIRGAAVPSLLPAPTT
jgi:transposase